MRNSKHILVFRGTGVFHIVGFMCLTLALISQTYAQPASIRAVNTTDNRVLTLSNNVELRRDVENNSHRKVVLPGVDSKPYNPEKMELRLDWTNCKIHRVETSSPIEITLNGSISCTIGNIWALSPISRPNSIESNLPLLNFVEDISGRTGSTNGSNIAVLWEISIDGGTFMPMTVQPDNTITAFFPPGNHNFCLRIFGLPDYHQPDGYYRLQLSQTLIPQF